ncbi:MAG: PGF-pre-PGF domain-containing protein [Halobacteria archaeon]|nr:PGF-pre-PGF domain-containing protein [Halobacteria archaeon]
MTMRAKSLVAVLLTLLLVTSPVAAQESVNVNIVSGNEIDVSVSNAKPNDGATISIPSTTAAEKHYGVNLNELTIWHSKGTTTSYEISIQVRAGSYSGTPPIDGIKFLAQYSIGHSNLKTEDMSDVRMRFRVKKNKLEQLNADPDDVVFYRYANGEWTQLQSRLEDEFPSEYAFYINTNRLSVIGVGVKQATFELSNVQLGQNTIHEGESVDVTATVENTGTVAGGYSASLKVDGSTVDTQTVNVKPGRSKKVTFTYTFDQIGVYEVGIGESTAGELRVESGGGGSDSEANETGGQNGEVQNGTGQGSNTNTVPGFNVVVALVALAVASVLLLRRR